jgi:hypothetical protein
VNHRPEIGHILVANVALIRTRVHRDALSTIFLTAFGSQNKIRNLTTSRIANGGNFVDVYTKFRHSFVPKKTGFLYFLVLRKNPGMVFDV